MTPPLSAFWALFWVKPGWQTYFSDTVGEVRRSFLPLGIEFAMLIGVWLILGSEGLGVGFADLLLQSAINLAATACFLTLFATVALRFGYSVGLCRVIAAYNWLSLMMAIMVQALVLLSHVIVSSSLLLFSNSLLFFWLNATLFRLMQQAMKLPIVAIVAALILQAFLAMIFLRITLGMQMHFTSVSVF